MLNSLKEACSSAAAIFMTFTLAGCGSSDGLAREGVSGKVTLDGKPLASGFITFMPAAAELATQGGSIIQEGNYSIPREQGLVPGNYKVSITSSESGSEKKTDTVTDMPGMPPVIPKDALPAQYNSKTTLTAEVKAGGENVFDYPLDASAKASPKKK